MVGVHLQGVEPSKSNPVQITYKGNIDGVDWNEIRVVTDKEGYSIITFKVNP